MIPFEGKIQAKKEELSEKNNVDRETLLHIQQSDYGLDALRTRVAVLEEDYLDERRFISELSQEYIPEMFVQTDLNIRQLEKRLKDATDGNVVVIHDFDPIDNTMPRQKFRRINDKLVTISPEDIRARYWPSQLADYQWQTKTDMMQESIFLAKFKDDKYWILGSKKTANFLKLVDMSSNDFKINSLLYFKEKELWEECASENAKAYTSSEWQLSTLEQTINNAKKRISEKIQTRDNDYAYLDNVLDIIKELDTGELFINKSQTNEYSLRDDKGNIIYRFKDGKTEAVLETNKNRMLKIQETYANLERAFKLSNIDDVVYFTEDGIILSGQSKEIAEKVYNLASKKNPIIDRLADLTDEEGKVTTYRKTTSTSDEQVNNIFRTCTQKYLANIDPEPTEGSLFASGASYKAYRVGSDVVVEFDQDDSATYVFDSSKWNNDLSYSRNEILKHRPNGFRFRIIHDDHNDYVGWVGRINELVQ